MGFAQHQSFYIRSNWISKGLNNLSETDTDFFSDKENHLKLGIGKNMFSSLRFWMIATNLAEVTNKNRLRLTDFGKIIKKYDINCLYNDTLSIIHFWLCSSNSISESWYWFFNVFTSATALKEQTIFPSLVNWASNKQSTVSEKTLHRDLDTLIQFYTAVENSDDPEDILFSEFSRLNLIKEENENGALFIRKTLPSIDRIGLTALMYVLLTYCQQTNSYILPVQDILQKQNLWGKVFNFDRQTTMDALNKLSLQKENKISFQRTNNLDLVVCPQIDPDDYLLKQYKGAKL